MEVLLHAILDDASRLIPHAQLYASEGLDACLDCLRQAIAARGVPVRLYTDNAKIYRSPQLARISASIGMLIVHTLRTSPRSGGRSSDSCARHGNSSSTIWIANTRSCSMS